jgi:DNA-binding XRE family transcriptional regulator
MTPLDQIAPAEMGDRLRIARDGLKIKQADAATAIGVARTTLVAIEQASDAPK